MRVIRRPRRESAPLQRQRLRRDAGRHGVRLFARAARRNTAPPSPPTTARRSRPLRTRAWARARRGSRRAGPSTKASTRRGGSRGAIGCNPSTVRHAPRPEQRRECDCVPTRDVSASRRPDLQSFASCKAPLCTARTACFLNARLRTSDVQRGHGRFRLFQRHRRHAKTRGPSSARARCITGNYSATLQRGRNPFVAFSNSPAPTAAGLESCHGNCIQPKYTLQPGLPGVQLRVHPDRCGLLPLSNLEQLPAE